MNRASVFQVSNESYCQIFEASLRFADRVEIEHCLRRMLVSAVAGVDYWGFGNLGSVSRSSFEIVTHYDEVDIVRHHFYSVFQCLAFRRARCGSITEAYHAASEAVDCGFKTQTRARRRFKKEGRHNFSFEQPSVRISLERSSAVEQPQNFVAVDIGDRHQGIVVHDWPE
jgi:hypothetical protein